MFNSGKFLKEYNLFNSFKNLYVLVNLKFININCNNISSFSDFPELQKLEKLYCNFNKIKSFEYLLTENLRELQIINSGIESLENFINFKNLEIINCEKCPLKTLFHIIYIKKLKKINFDFNTILLQNTIADLTNDDLKNKFKSKCLKIFIKNLNSKNQDEESSILRHLKLI